MIWRSWQAYNRIYHSCHRSQLFVGIRPACVSACDAHRTVPCRRRRRIFRGVLPSSRRRFLPDSNHAGLQGGRVRQGPCYPGWCVRLAGGLTE